MNKPAFGASQVSKGIGQRKKTFLINLDAIEMGLPV